MARYIDEKDVYKLVEPTGIARVHCSQIDELPRADVVPKSEVERLRKALDEYEETSGLNKAKAEVALSLIEHLESEGLLNMTPQGIANLKKKYTGGTP